MTTEWLLRLICRVRGHEWSRWLLRAESPPYRVCLRCNRIEYAR